MRRDGTGLWREVSVGDEVQTDLRPIVVQLVFLNGGAASPIDRAIVARSHKHP